MPPVRHAMFLLLTLTMTVAASVAVAEAAAPDVNLPEPPSAGTVTDSAAWNHDKRENSFPVTGSSGPRVRFVAERKYQEPEIAYGRTVLAVRRASSMGQVLYLLSKDQREVLQSQQKDWPNVKKWRLEYQRRDRKAGRSSEQAKDPRYFRSPFENELQSLKDTFDNVVDVKSCKIDGDKATLKVLTKGDVIKNGHKLYRTETVTMVREKGRWLYSHTRTGSVAIGFY